MSSTSSDRITLTGSQRHQLQRLTRAGRTEQRLAVRAKIVLAASTGESNAQIARSLRVCRVRTPCANGDAAGAPCAGECRVKRDWRVRRISKGALSHWFSGSLGGLVSAAHFRTGSRAGVRH